MSAEPRGTASCPACRTMMVARQSGSIVLDHCGACGGTWFDASELQAYVSQRLPGLEPLRVGGRGEDTGAACPRCAGERLLRRRFDGIALQVCSRCEGIFLGKGGVLAVTRHLSGRKKAGESSVFDSPAFHVLEVIGELLSGLGT